MLSTILSILSIAMAGIVAMVAVGVAVAVVMLAATIGCIIATWIDGKD